MPYIPGSQRYGSSRTATVTRNLANLTKTMGRYQGASAAPPVTGGRATEGSLENTRRAHPLPPRPQQPTYYDHGFRPGGLSGEAGRNQVGYGGYGGYQQHYGQQEYQGQLYGKSHWQQQGWQGTGYQHQPQRYTGTADQYSWQGQGTSNQGHLSTSWQQPTAQYPDLPPTTPADQAWQAEYFRQYQQYAHSLQNRLYPQFVLKGQTNNQYGLTQSWQTVNDADRSSATQLDASTAAFTPQAAPLKYARTKPNASNPKFTPANGSFPVPQSSAGQIYNAGNGYWRAPQRTGPAANRRSFTRIMEAPEAKVKVQTKHLLQRPYPTAEYTAQAAKDPETLSSPRPLLVILDLNGTLLHRMRRGGSNFKARPHVNEFLHYLLKNHHVMVWSSAQPTNVDGMCKQLLNQDQMDQLVAKWSRKDLHLPPHAYNQKCQIYKQLSWVWDDPNIQVKSPAPWSQADTVLIDDSIEKAASEPHNIIELTEFEGKDDQMEIDVLGQVVKYLEALRWEKDVSAYIRSKPFVFDAEMSFDWTQVVEGQSSLMA